MNASAADFLPRGRNLTSLRRAAQGCHGCDLWKDATQTVFGEGRARAELMLVGEQPGDQEDRQGEPFVGPAGGLLDRVLDEAGIARDDVHPSAILRIREREESHDALAGLVEDLEAVCAALEHGAEH
jgi:uracil-DNA glycosylase